MTTSVFGLVLILLGIVVFAISMTRQALQGDSVVTVNYMGGDMMEMLIGYGMAKTDLQKGFRDFIKMPSRMLYYPMVCVNNKNCSTIVDNNYNGGYDKDGKKISGLKGWSDNVLPYITIGLTWVKLYNPSVSLDTIEPGTLLKIPQRR